MSHLFGPSPLPAQNFQPFQHGDGGDCGDGDGGEDYLVFFPRMVVVKMVVILVRIMVIRLMVIVLSLMVEVMVVWCSFLSTAKMEKINGFLSMCIILRKGERPKERKLKKLQFILDDENYYTMMMMIDDEENPPQVAICCG